MMEGDLNFSAAEDYSLFRRRTSSHQEGRGGVSLKGEPGAIFGQGGNSTRPQPDEGQLF